MCILGLDVVGLFLAMKSKNSGKILRRQAVKGPLKVKGFKWKHGTRYIRVNKHLTGDLSKVAKFLPWRRFSGGVAPGMTSEEANSIDGDVEKQWCFPRCEPNEQEEKEIIARCAEIATRTIFENFCYKFGGKTYQQSDGGPIGARVTMCLARVVMHDWGEQYQMILTKACLRIALLGSYVDDVRQGTTVLRLGMRFDHTAMEFKWSMEAELEDTRLKEIGQEPTNKRMARTCLPAMNAINPDLVFTAEVPEDFGDGKLPTLDFKTWHIGSLEAESQASFGGMPANSKVKDYRLNHSYFEKEMRTPYVIMKRSAMSDHSRYNILANELVRRLSNMKREETTQEEKEEVVEHFIQQCKTSGYSRHETREGVISGLKGWKRKCVRRERDGVDFYRSGRSTLGARTKKKLTEKSTWYKKKRKREEEEDETAKTSPRKKQRGREGEGGSGGGLEVQKPGSCEGSNANKSEEVQESAIAVIMVPFTKGAELAKRVRQYEMMAREQTGWYLKVVERAGDSLTDLLHRSDPWSGEDCQREACLHCETKLWSGKYKTQDCSKRNCIYETWCRTCQEREEERIEEACGEDEERKMEMKKKIKLHKYVGETSRSVYERAWEHTHSRDQLQTSSHMLKHIIEMHGEEENPDKIQFGVRVVRYTRRAFERQIMESVFIQEERSHFILNSKSEYNRCSLPRLTSNLGNREWKKRKKEEEEEKEREAALERVITTMRKERNNRRKDNAKRQDEPAEKRRKIGEEEWKRVKQTREIGEKRREREEKEEENPSKRRKTNDIRNYMGDKIGGEEKTREEAEEQVAGEKENEEKIPTANSEQEGATYGSWQTGEFMEKDFWDKFLEERKERLEKEEKERKERQERAKREEKSWELARWCKKTIEETKSESWFKNKEIRKEQEKYEREKKERFRVIKEKKKEMEEKQNQRTKQTTLIEMLKKVPSREREMIELEERRMKRLELQEIKQNVWRKWRGGKRKENTETKTETKEEEIERENQKDRKNPRETKRRETGRREKSKRVERQTEETVRRGEEQTRRNRKQKQKQKK